MIISDAIKVEGITNRLTLVVTDGVDVTAPLSSILARFGCELNFFRFVLGAATDVVISPSAANVVSSPFRRAVVRMTPVRNKWFLWLQRSKVS